MALITVIRKEHAQALSNRVVISLIACLIIASLLMVVTTVCVLVEAGYLWLAVFVVPALGTGLGHYCVVTTRYCRPAWFKPVLDVESE